MQKTIKQLQTRQNNETTIITNGFQILIYCKTFYLTLYTKTKTHPKIQKTLLEKLKPKINYEENENLIKQITFTELKTAIFRMENRKSPGIDDLAIEFYKSQYEIIKNDILKLYNSILLKNKDLSHSMNQAIITLLPKNNEKDLLKNWRPISLLCVDYKILTKIISNRLKPTLDITISKEQTWGIPNRSIFSNLFTIRELIHHSTKKDIKTYIVSTDQEKAFDKFDRDFLYKIMEKLGYSNTFISFIKKIYKNT